MKRKAFQLIFKSKSLRRPGKTNYSKSLDSVSVYFFKPRDKFDCLAEYRSNTNRIANLLNELYNEKTKSMANDAFEYNEVFFSVYKYSS